MNGGVTEALDLVMINVEPVRRRVVQKSKSASHGLLGHRGRRQAEKPDIPLGGALRGGRIGGFALPGL